ncbi:MAG: hypothetical protein AAF211_13650 [Myxococcota bacterium]
MSRWLGLGVAMAAMGCAGGDGAADPAVVGGPGEGGEASGFDGILTFDEYDWFAVEAHLGVVQYELDSGTKRRLAEGSRPWTHASGATVFLQGCGDLVSRVALRGTDGLVDVLTPCSSELAPREFLNPDFGVAKLSPDETMVAVETFYFVDFEYEVTTSVFEGGELVVEIDGLYAPEWTPDGQLVLAGEGLFLTEAPFDDLTRIDGDRLNAAVGNPAVRTGNASPSSSTSRSGKSGWTAATSGSGSWGRGACGTPRGRLTARYWPTSGSNRRTTTTRASTSPRCATARAHTSTSRRSSVRIRVWCRTVLSAGADGLSGPGHAARRLSFIGRRRVRLTGAANGLLKQSGPCSGGNQSVSNRFRGFATAWFRYWQISFRPPCVAYQIHKP